MHDKKSAFTLIELSVVLVIITILAFGLMKASGMVKASRIANARSITANSIVPKIDGLVAWYDSSSQRSFNIDETYDGAQLTQWFDISPASIVEEKNVLTKSANSAVIYTESGINNLPSVENTSGANSLTAFTLTDLYQGTILPATVFIVARLKSIWTGSDICFIDSYSSASSPSRICVRDGAIKINAGSGGVSYGSGVTANTDYVISAYLNDSNSRAYLNDAENNLSGSGSIGSYPIDGITTSCYKDSTHCFVGLYSEIIIYNRPLTKQERKDVMKYLATKYQIPVDNT